MRLAAALLVCLPVMAADLKLTLTAVTPEVVAGSPIVLRASIEAVGGEVADVPVISPEAGNFELWVANLNTGERTRYLGPQWSEEERSAAMQNLRPDAPAVAYLKLLASAKSDGSLPFVPARWQFNLQYKGLGPDKPLYGQAMVTVREPAGGDEAEWSQALQRTPAVAQAIQLGIASPSAVPVLEALLKQHQSAPQANAAALALGRYYLQTRKDSVKAIEFFRMAGGPTADALTRREALAESANALEATGSKYEADAIRRQMDAERTGAPSAVRPAPATGPAPTVGPVKQP